jgi:hypothetical protein
MSYETVGVYYDSETVRYQLSQFKNFQPFRDCTTFVDSSLFIGSKLSCKIAVLHVPYPFHNEFVDKVNVLLNHADHIFIIATEVHPEIVEFIKNTDNKRVTYYICGMLNFEMTHSEVKQFMDWFETSTYFYRHWLPEILTRLKPHETKYKEFDILLGRKKLHRDELYKFAKDRPGLSILTYFNDHNTILNDNPEKWIWEHTGVKIDQTPEWTVNIVNYFGHPMSLSQIIPISIYNLTAYTAVAETCFDDRFSFYTEKTSKPIIARRLFVMFAGRGYLQNLRKLGFQTFDSIIDEGYDYESDSLIRWRWAWEEMMKLAQRSQEEVLALVKPIVEHNFTHMMTTNWAEDFRNSLEQDLVRIIAD